MMVFSAFFASSAVNIYFKYLLDFLDNIKVKRN